MRFRVIGSGTLRPDPDRGSPGYWVECRGRGILVDCGTGTLRNMARFGVAWQRVTHLVISHFHTDHVADIAPLLFALKHGIDRPRNDPLTILGPPGVQDHMEALARAHGDFVLDPGFPVEIVGLTPGDPWICPSGAFRLNSYDTIHAHPSLAFRLEADGGALGYTGDTGPDPSLGRFMCGCHLLVAECSNPDGAETEFHLTPASLAELAGLARPELLITVHVYPPLFPGDVPDLLRKRGYEGKVLAGRDGLTVTLGDGLLRDATYSY